MKAIRIFLLILILIGIGLLCTIKIWVPKLVEKITESDKPFEIIQPSAVPSIPTPKPLIGETYSSDANRDRIEDVLMKKAQDASVAGDTVKLNTLVSLELIFREQITQAQMDAFLALGGKIDYVYKAVSYGWNGSLPLGKVLGLAAAMGDTLLFVQEPKMAKFE